MRTVLIFGLALAACLAGGPGARAQAQNEFDQLVATSGATNGAAQACGATPQALARHKEVMLANLRRYAAEFGYSAGQLAPVFEQGRDKGRHMMLDMRQRGVDGCTGVMSGFRQEQAMGYEAMKQAIGEITDGLPEPGR
ncbi:hypothetical protein CAL18_13635 [Bordetella genomosp. 7]|uniref:hypothetical protein n=1 Tax=Bordetella genomosp. 7 TaxID=1416805 RepID=UPI000B9E8CD0|nr:hypothetical protein [Bordetella genomosp. 7]OZI21937.1 hypothetical protein CAL18_13635 [Bordetella genomosp. 7]